MYDIITIPFIPSKLDKEVIVAEFTKVLAELGVVDNIELWTYEMPYSLASNDESFFWHTDFDIESKIISATWANIFSSELRNRITKKEINIDAENIIIYCDRNYEHRVPRLVETGKGRRWFVRSRIELFEISS